MRGPVAPGLLGIVALLLAGCASAPPSNQVSDEAPDGAAATAAAPGASVGAAEDSEQGGRPAGDSHAPAEAESGAVQTSPGTRCADGQRCLAPFSRLEQISMAQAQEWWPYRPLLMPAGPLSTAEHEYGIAASTHAQTGRQGDPRTSDCDVYLFRYGVGRDFEMRRFFHMLGDGAIVLQHTTQAAGPNSQPRDPDGFVEIRGRRAFYFEAIGADSPDGKVNFRSVSWFDVHPDGRQVEFLVWSDPTVYSMDEVVAWANSLREA